MARKKNGREEPLDPVTAAREALDAATAKRDEMQQRIYSKAIAQFENELQERLARADRLACDYGLMVMQAIYDVVAKEPETARERANTAIRFSKTFADAYDLVHTGVSLEQLKEQYEQLLQDRIAA